MMNEILINYYYYDEKLHQTFSQKSILTNTRERREGDFFFQTTSEFSFVGFKALQGEKHKSKIGVFISKTN